MLPILLILVLAGLAVWFLSRSGGSAAIGPGVSAATLAAAVFGVLALALLMMRQIVPALALGGLAALAGTGQLNWLLGRLAPAKDGPRIGHAGSGQTTQVSTRCVELTLDHATGELWGQVLRGPFAGRAIAELSHAEALALYRDCRVNDQQAAGILETYLERLHGPDWREEPEPRRRSARPTQMEVDEALEILGLPPGATAEEIREAHRRLMQQVHPDRGGSDYLAAKINAAKDLLLFGEA